MSREAFERIVNAYESWEPERAYEDRVCIYEVSKILRGRSQVERQDKQECPEQKCVTLKRYARFEMRIESGPCDSEVSKETLNGTLEGEAVSAYIDGDPDRRGGITGRFKWGGQGSTAVGRIMAIANAGTHHEPLKDCEKCNEPHHMEAWLRAAVVDGHSEGCRIAGAVAMNVDPIGDGSKEAAQIGTFEGLLICQCDD